MAGNEEARSGPAGRRRAGSAFRPQQITSQLASYPSDSPVPWRQVILVGQDQSEVLDAVLSGRADVGCRAVSASLQSGFSVATLARSTRLPAPPTGTSYSDTGASGGSCRTLHHRPVPLRRATRTHLPCELSNSRPCARAPLGRAGWCGLASWKAQRGRAGAASSSTCTSCRLGPTSRCRSPRRCADQQSPPPCTRMSPTAA